MKIIVESVQYFVKGGRVKTVDGREFSLSMFDRGTPVKGSVWDYDMVLGIFRPVK